MADGGWPSRSHADIVAKLSDLKSNHAYDLGNTWTEMYTKVSDAGDKLDLARRKLATEGFWTGKGPAAALRTLSARVTEYDDSETGIPALAGKMSNALAQDGEVLTSAHHVAQAHPELGSGAPTDRKKEELQAIRAEAQRLYTAPAGGQAPRNHRQRRPADGRRHAARAGWKQRWWQQRYRRWWWSISSITFWIRRFGEQGH